MYVLASKRKKCKPFFRKKHDDEPLDEPDDKPLDADSTKPVPSKTNEPMKCRNKIRRGYGKKNDRKNKTKKINLSIIGTNAAGLKSKQESFFNMINTFKASIITIQETKHTRPGVLKLQGYQTFEKVRSN